MTRRNEGQMVTNETRFRGSVLKLVIDYQPLVVTLLDGMTSRALMFSFPNPDPMGFHNQ